VILYLFDYSLDLSTHLMHVSSELSKAVVPIEINQTMLWLSFEFSFTYRDLLLME